MQSGSLIIIKPSYWFAMLIASALGTVIGDSLSFGLKDHECGPKKGVPWPR